MFEAIRQIVSRESAERRRQAGIRELERLSDHQLADIGLRREELFLLGREQTADHGRRPAPERMLRLGLEPCG